MILCFSKATCFTLASASALSGPCTRVDLNFFPTYEATVRLRGFPGGPSGKEPVCQCRRHKTWVRSPGWEDPPEQDMATPSSISLCQKPHSSPPKVFFHPLYYCCSLFLKSGLVFSHPKSLENSMDRGAWRATVHGVSKSWT